jgi:hypothetical protein
MLRGRGLRRLYGGLFGVAVCAALTFASGAHSGAAIDPLPSWNEGAARQRLLAFVSRVVSGPDAVAPADRIAVFDNDGTLWCEQPIYVQFAFAIDRVKALAPPHPDWATREPFASVLKGDLQAALAGGERAVADILAATHAGVATDEFDRIVSGWIATARHPKTGRPYTAMVYQPMIELLEYLRANGFKTFVVSGGGIDFMRPWTEATYGLPPEQVVGSSGRTRYEMRGGTPVLIKLPEIDFVDDKDGKPTGIQRFIGRRPILAFGNSDGDRQMLEWTAAGSGTAFRRPRSPYGRSARVRLRPQLVDWPPRPGARRSGRP